MLQINTDRFSPNLNRSENSSSKREAGSALSRHMENSPLSIMGFGNRINIRLNSITNEESSPLPKQVKEVKDSIRYDSLKTMNKIIR
jgi:hypothetical protein